MEKSPLTGWFLSGGQSTSSTKLQTNIKPMTKGNSKAKQRRRVRHGEKALNGATANKMMGAVVRHNYGGGKADHYRNPDDRNLDA